MSMISPDLARAASVLVGDQMAVKAGDSVLITVDTDADLVAAQAVLNAAALLDAKPSILVSPPLPFQGALADPYLSETFQSAAKSCDVWIDMCFPYLAGSKLHSEALKSNRLRYLLAADLDTGSMIRLFGKVDLDALFEVQAAFDGLISRSVGGQCRITTKAGMDVAFKLAKPGYEKLRRANRPGLNVPPGSGMIYPEPETVKGTVVIESVFHEYFTELRIPMRMDVDGQIRSLEGGGSERPVMDRALKRAGGGKYGQVIHFTCGFHPAAQAHRTLIEEIRVAGNNAVGLGLPWWVPNGGENHPDGIASEQSIWIDGEQIAADGVLVGPAELAGLAANLAPIYR